MKEYLYLHAETINDSGCTAFFDQYGRRIASVVSSYLKQETNNQSRAELCIQASCVIDGLLYKSTLNEVKSIGSEVSDGYIYLSQSPLHPDRLQDQDGAILFGANIKMLDDEPLCSYLIDVALYKLIDGSPIPVKYPFGATGETK